MGRRAARDPYPAKRWLTFLRNHREAIAAMDFFTVPTLTFGVLYCFFVIGHDRRKILHFNVTRNPNTLWMVQQLREGGPTSSRTDSCYLTETQSLEPMWFQLCGTSEASPPDCLSQSVAERGCRTLGWKLPTRLA